jgi:hypothetical protein
MIGYSGLTSGSVSRSRLRSARATHTAVPHTPVEVDAPNVQWSNTRNSLMVQILAGTTGVRRSV